MSESARGNPSETTRGQPGTETGIAGAEAMAHYRRLGGPNDVPRENHSPPSLTMTGKSQERRHAELPC